MSAFNRKPALRTLSVIYFPVQSNFDGETCSSCEVCLDGTSTSTDCSNIDPDAVDTNCVQETAVEYQVLKLSATAECAGAPPPSGAGAPNSGAGAYDYGIHFSFFVALSSILVIRFW